MMTLREICTRRNLLLAAAGSFAVLLYVGVVLAGPLINVTICHKGQTITVDAHSLPAHRAHGPSLLRGACQTLRHHCRVRGRHIRSATPAASSGCCL